MAGNNTSERTKVMMKNFMTDHKNGLSIAEIADKYELSCMTVYRRLEEIAKNEGVLREELLKVIHTHASDSVWQKRHEQTKVNLANLKENISQTIISTNSLLENLKNILKEGDFEK